MPFFRRMKMRTVAICAAGSAAGLAVVAVLYLTGPELLYSGIYEILCRLGNVSLYSKDQCCRVLLQRIAQIAMWILLCVPRRNRIFFRLFLLGFCFFSSVMVSCLTIYCRKTGIFVFLALVFPQYLLYIPACSLICTERGGYPAAKALVLYAAGIGLELYVNPILIHVVTKIT